MDWIRWSKDLLTLLHREVKLRYVSINQCQEREQLPGSGHSKIICDVSLQNSCYIFILFHGFKLRLQNEEERFVSFFKSHWTSF